MPALLAMKGGKGPFDHTWTEAQATWRKQGLGVAQISQQAFLQTRQVVGGDDGELVASRVQHMQRMGKTETIGIEIRLHRRLMHPGPYRIMGEQQAVEFLIEQFG